MDINKSENADNFEIETSNSFKHNSQCEYDGSEIMQNELVLKVNILYLETYRYPWETGSSNTIRTYIKLTNLSNLVRELNLIINNPDNKNLENTELYFDYESKSCVCPICKKVFKENSECVKIGKIRIHYSCTSDLVKIISNYINSQNLLSRMI